MAGPSRRGSGSKRGSPSGASSSLLAVPGSKVAATRLHGTDSPQASAGDDSMRENTALFVAARAQQSERPRWADMADSSQEGPCEEPAPAPLAEDSYRGAPVAEFDSSRTGLNGRLKAGAGLDDPKDFAFLFHDPARLSTSEASFPSTFGFRNVAAASTGIEGSAQGRLNAADNNVDQAVSESAPRGGSGVASSRPTKARQGKRQTSTTANQVQARKRVRGAEEVMSEEVPNVATIQHSPASASAAVPTPQVLAVQLEIPQVVELAIIQPPPPASEEDWQHREEKRRRAVTIVKASEEYQIFATVKQSEVRTDREPRTPDAADRLISKRRWEQEVQQWRAGLRKWCVERGIQASNGCSAMLEDVDNDR